MTSTGPLALIGGDEWQEGCTFDGRLIKAVEPKEVLVVPTAAAYEWPTRSVEKAESWFGQWDVKVTGLPVLKRHEANDPVNVAKVRAARLIYFSDGSPLHLRSVLKDSAMWDAIVAAWHDGAAIAASSAGAMVLGDPMIDPRGGAFTLGLGLIKKTAVVPHWKRWTGDKVRRMTQLAPKDVLLLEIEERTALIRWADGTWDQEGVGSVTLNLNGQDVGFDRLSEVSATP